MAGGLTIAMLAKPKPGMESEDEGDEAPPSSKPGGSSAKKLVRLAVEAIADGDTDAATDALLGAIQACGGEME